MFIKRCYSVSMLMGYRIFSLPLAEKKDMHLMGLRNAVYLVEFRVYINRSEINSASTRFLSRAQSLPCRAKMLTIVEVFNHNASNSADLHKFFRETGKG